MRLRVYIALAVMLGIGLAAVLLTVTPLQQPHAGPDRVAAAENIAEAAWGQVCGGAPVDVHRGDVPEGALARARYRFPSGSNDQADRYFNCEITLKRGTIPWGKFCTALVHEYGHLAGWRARSGEEFVRGDGTKDRYHARSRRSIMYPHFEHVFSGCREAEVGLDLPPPAPLVLLLPPGGFQHADPAVMRPWVDDFAKHGSEARAISYPLRDVAAAIEYVAKIAANEPRPVIAYGLSAGGTIAAGAAAIGAVDGAVDIAGPVDFTRWVSPAGLKIMRDIGMTSYAEKRAASPYWRLGGRQTPQLLQYGVADPLVEFTQGERYASAAWRGNPDTTLQRLVNGHGQSSYDRTRARNWIVTRWGT